MKTSFWTRILDLISPRQCVICGERLSITERAVCSSCYLHLPRTTYQFTPYDNPMAQLFWGLAPISRAAALFFYEPHAEAAQLIYDLKYAGKSGRIPSAAAFVGDKLGIKPIMKIWDHEILTAAKCRGEKKLVAKICHLVLEDMEPGTPYQIIYGDNPLPRDEMTEMMVKSTE